MCGVGIFQSKGKQSSRVTSGHVLMYYRSFVHAFFTCFSSRIFHIVPLIKGAYLQPLPPLFFASSALPSKARSRRYCTGRGASPRCQLKCPRDLTASQTIHWPTPPSRATQRGSSLWSGQASPTGTAPGSASCRWDSRSRSSLKWALQLASATGTCVLSVKKNWSTQPARASTGQGSAHWTVCHSLFMVPPLAV